MKVILQQDVRGQGKKGQMIDAAEGYARHSGISFGQGLVKNRYIGRTFIAPNQSLRALGVRMKLNPLRHNIRGKRLVVVDDSIVRGTTTRGMVGMLREAGATEVHLRISSPPSASRSAAPGHPPWPTHPDKAPRSRCRRRSRRRSGSNRWCGRCSSMRKILSNMRSRRRMPRPQSPVPRRRTEAADWSPPCQPPRCKTTQPTTLPHSRCMPI